MFIRSLWYVSGIRITILEALANGLPVISTSIGASGLSDEIRKAIYIADTKEEFIQKINTLFENPETYQRCIEFGQRALRSFNKDSKIDLSVDLIRLRENPTGY